MHICLWTVHSRADRGDTGNVAIRFWQEKSTKIKKTITVQVLYTCFLSICPVHSQVYVMLSVMLKGFHSEWIHTSNIIPIIIILFASVITRATTTYSNNTTIKTPWAESNCSFCGKNNFVPFVKYQLLFSGYIHTCSSCTILFFLFWIITAECLLKQLCYTLNAVLSLRVNSGVPLQQFI